MSKLKAAFALCLVDDFSGRSIQGKKFRFLSDGRAVSAIDKRDGLYVFLEPKEEETRLLVDGADYYPANICVRKAELDPAQPIQEVRLYGRPGGRFPYPYELFTGVLKGAVQDYGTEILVERARPVGLKFRELKEAEDGIRIVFQGFTKEELTGKPYILGGGERPCPFILTERKGINEYSVRLSGGSLGGVEEGAPLMRVYRSVAEKNGAYAVQVENKAECRLLHIPAAR